MRRDIDKDYRHNRVIIMNRIQQFFNRHFVRPVIITKAFLDDTKTQTLWYEAHEKPNGFFMILQLHSSKAGVEMRNFDEGEQYSREQIVDIFADLEKQLSSSYEETAHRNKHAVTEINGQGVMRKKRVHYSIA